MVIPLWFMIIFTIVWLFGSGGQLIAVFSQRLHQKLGLTESRAFEPEFKWYLVDEHAIAYADIVHFITGFLFILFYILGDQNLALKLGCFTFAVYVYVFPLCVFRFYFLSKNNLYPTQDKKETRKVLLILTIFGLYYIFGTWYLWRLL